MRVSASGGSGVTPSACGTCASACVAVPTGGRAGRLLPPAGTDSSGARTDLDGVLADGMDAVNALPQEAST